MLKLKNLEPKVKMCEEEIEEIYITLDQISHVKNEWLALLLSMWFCIPLMHFQVCLVLLETLKVSLGVSVRVRDSVVCVL